MNSKDIILKDI